MAHKDENRVVIHLSSKTIHTVVAKQSPCKTKYEVLGVGVASHNSFSNGQILHLERLRSAIKKSVGQAEEMANLRIYSAIACFSSAEMVSGNAKGEIAVNDGVVDYDDMAAVLANAKSSWIHPTYYLSHFVPQAFWIDDAKEPVEHVVGLTGVSNLKANYHLMTVPATTLNRIYEVLDSCSVHVDGTIFDVLAGAEYALIEDDCRQGVLFIDIGADSTNFCVYKENILLHSATLGVGSQMITEIIAYRLGVNNTEAERLKRYHLSLNNQEEDKQLFVDMSEGVVNFELLSKTAQAGFDEIFRLIDENIATSPVAQFRWTGLGAGIVLLGGGSQVKGIVPYLKKKYPVPVHLANDEAGRLFKVAATKTLSDEAISDLSVLLKEERLRVALGAIMHAYNEESNHQHQIHLGNDANVPNSFFDKLKRWFSLD